MGHKMAPSQRNFTSEIVFDRIKSLTQRFYHFFLIFQELIFRYLENLNPEKKQSSGQINTFLFCCLMIILSRKLLCGSQSYFSIQDSFFGRKMIMQFALFYFRAKALRGQKFIFLIEVQFLAQKVISQFTLSNLLFEIHFLGRKMILEFLFFNKKTIIKK